jgi:flavin reductase (DIM6/NTAB) family NADH-FMN oxidoreductase RutF
MARPITRIEHAPTAQEWRAAMGCFPSGVTIVTSWRDSAPVGSTVNAFCSVSLDPPLLLVCLDVSNPILAPIQKCGVFGVNILHDEGQDVALQFATAPEDERFSPDAYQSIDSGAPQLVAAPVFIDCVLQDAHLAGDHFIMVGRGVRVDHASTAAPLLYHKGGFFKFGS